MKHIYVSPERGNVGEIWALHLGARGGAALECGLHSPPAATRSRADVPPAVDFTPRDCVFVTPPPRSDLRKLSRPRAQSISVTQAQRCLVTDSEIGSQNVIVIEVRTSR